MTTSVDTRVEKNFQIETFRTKSDRDARWHELRDRRSDDAERRPGLVRFSGVSTWSVAWPIRLSARRRDRDRRMPTGPSPKKQRRSRYWRRHPLLHRIIA